MYSLSCSGGVGGEDWSAARLEPRSALFLRLDENVFREPYDFFDDDRHAGKQLDRDRGQAIDERFEVTDVAEVIGEEIARFFAEGFSDADEVLDIEAALIRFEPCELRR